MTALLVLLLALPASAADNGRDVVKLVEYFLKTPTGELKPELVPHFMEVDPKTLPAKLQEPYQVKKEELNALRKASKKSALLRRIGQEEIKDCEIERTDDKGLGILKLAGYAEIYENEEVHVINKTSCTECELVEEFTLRMLLLPPKKPGGKKRKVFLLHGNDPLWIYVGAYRKGNENPFGTGFFGIGGGPKCR